MNVLFFARVRDLAGANEVDIELPAGATVRDLRLEVERRTPALGPLLPKCAVAVNDEYANDAVVLRPGDRVALLPPVSGG